MACAALIRRIRHDPEFITWHLSTSPDKSKIAIHRSSSVIFADVASGKHLCGYEFVHISARGEFVDNDYYVFMTTGVINVYSTVQKRRVWVIGAHQVMRLVVHPTLPRFFFSQTGRVSGYDISTRRQIGEWPADNYNVSLLGCHDDWLLLGGRGLFKLHMSTGDNEILSSDNGFFGGYMSPNGRHLVHQWWDNIVYFTDLETGDKKEARMRANSLTKFSFMDDNRRGVIQSRDTRGDEYTLVDVVAGTLLRTFRYGSWARMGPFLRHDVVPVTGLDDSTIDYISFCPFWTRAVHRLLGQECRAVIETVFLCRHRMGNGGGWVLPELPLEMWLHVLSFYGIGKALDVVGQPGIPGQAEIAG